MKRFGLATVLDAILLAGETAWIWGWVLTVGSWIGGSRRPLLPLPVLLALLLVPAVLARLASTKSNSRRRLALGATVLLGVVAVVVAAVAQLPLESGIPADFSALNGWLDGEQAGRAFLAGGAAGLAWRRGLGLGRSASDVSTVDECFGMGIVAFASLLALVGVSSGATGVSSDALIPPTAVMLVSGLIAMPLARITEVSSRPRNQHGPGLTMGGPWLVMLLAIVAAVLVVTLALARLFTFERIGAVLDAVGGQIDSVLRTVIYVLAIPFGLLVEALIFLARLLVRPGTEKPRQPQSTDWMDQLKDQAQAGQISPETLVALKFGLGILLAVVLGWVMWRAISRLQRMWEEDDVEEERETVWTWPGWGALWGWLLSRLRPIQKKTSALLSFHSGSEASDERTIRGLYREFLRLGATIGHPRHLPETPLEYGRRLCRVAPNGSEETRLISDAYSVEAYGPPAQGRADIVPLAQALGRLRTLWKTRAS